MERYFGRIQELDAVSYSMSLMGVNIGTHNTASQLVNIAETYGLSSGTIVDFIGTYYNGNSWDFSREDHRQAGRDLVCRSMPLVIIGTDLSNTQGVDWGGPTGTP